MSVSFLEVNNYKRLQTIIQTNASPENTTYQINFKKWCISVIVKVVKQLQ